MSDPFCQDCGCRLGGRHNPTCTGRLEARKVSASADYARGVADERARVVADLRKADAIAKDPETGLLLCGLAERYERGEHEREGT